MKKDIKNRFPQSIGGGPDGRAQNRMQLFPFEFSADNPQVGAFSKTILPVSTNR
jgi:hypothetical protein